VLDTLGWVHLKRGEVDRAVAVLEQAVELAPANASIRGHLAEALQQAGDSERAQRTLAGALPELEKAAAP
jgi:Flp pilus assembly protein TadD